jgi:hypothetical protein
MRKKHLTHSYFVCDWSGIPINNNRCYCPLLKGDRQVKYGTFLNWESVVAFIQHTTDDLRQRNMPAVDMWKESLDKVIKLAGYVPQPAPDFTVLKHFGGDMCIDDYVAECSKRKDLLEGVLIAPTGEVTEVKISTDVSHRHSIKHLLEAGNFDTIRIQKKLKTEGKTRQLIALADLCNNGDPNATFAGFFKNVGVKISGNVLLLVQREGIESDYLTSFSLPEFQQNFMPNAQPQAKRAGRREPGLTVAEFKAVKQSMQNKMNNVTDSIQTAGAPEAVTKRRRVK